MKNGHLIPFSRRAAGGVCLKDGFYICGGFGHRGIIEAAEVSSELWRCSDKWCLLESAPYAARYPSLCPDDAGGFYMFGGCGFDGVGTTFSNRIFHYDGGWSEVTPVCGPVPNGRYTSLFAKFGETLLVFGGNSQWKDKTHKVFYPSLWRFDLSSRCWERIHGEERGPGHRYGFGWCVDGCFAYLFGGYDGQRDRGDLWRLNLRSLEWTCLAEESSEPLARYCPALGRVQDRIVLFGGRSKARPKDNFSDTWVFDGEWHQFVESPAPGYHAKPAYASDGETMWLFGGEGPVGHVSDLWLFDAEGWHCKHKGRMDDPVFW